MEINADSAFIPFETRYSHAPSALGPESYQVIVTLDEILSAIILKGFLTQFGKEIYEWSKHKLSKVLKRKIYPKGSLIIKDNISNLSIEVWFEGLKEVDIQKTLFDICVFLEAENINRNNKEHIVLYYNENGSLSRLSRGD